MQSGTDEREERERLHNELVSMTSDWSAAQLKALISLLNGVYALAVSQGEPAHRDKTSQ